ncbi:MAG: hypothetical protein ACI8R8_003274, partial [Paraglaciecola sp.]
FKPELALTSGVKNGITYFRNGLREQDLNL